MDSVAESHELMSDFFANITKRIVEPEFMYGAIMAVGFVAVVLISIAAGVVLYKLAFKKKRVKPPVLPLSLPIPTLPELQVPKATRKTVLFPPDPDKRPTYGAVIGIENRLDTVDQDYEKIARRNEMAEAITQQILMNRPQPNC